jgi:hypothetical protein
MKVGDKIAFTFEEKFGIFEIIEIPDSNPGDLGKILLKLKSQRDDRIFNHYKTEDMIVVKERPSEHRI